MRDKSFIPIEDLRDSTITPFSFERTIGNQMNYSRKDLKLILRVLSLIYEHVYIPFSFVLKSELLQSVILEHLVLVEKGIIVFGYDNQYDSIYDYANNYPRYKVQGGLPGHRLPSTPINKNIETIIDHIKFTTQYNSNKMGADGKKLFFFFLEMSGYNRLLESIKKQYEKNNFNKLDKEWNLQWAKKNKIPHALFNVITGATMSAYIYAHKKYYDWEVELPSIQTTNIFNSGIFQEESLIQMLKKDVFDYIDVLGLVPEVVLNMNINEFIEFREDTLFQQIRRQISQRRFDKGGIISKEEIIEIIKDFVDSKKNKQFLNTNYQLLLLSLGPYLKHAPNNYNFYHSFLRMKSELLTSVFPRIPSLFSVPTNYHSKLPTSLPLASSQGWFSNYEFITQNRIINYEEENNLRLFLKKLFLSSEIIDIIINILID